MSTLNRVEALMLLVEFADSALPVGGFSFSAGLESAVAHGVVTNEASLGEFLRLSLRQVATCDGVAALASHRATGRRELNEAFETDRRLGLFKTGNEGLQMSLRMGRKLTDLAHQILPPHTFEAWSEALLAGRIEGHYATTAGHLFALLELDEEMLFTTLLYGSASQITGAALRLLRIDHFAVRRQLLHLGRVVSSLYGQVVTWDLEQMQLFAPELTILASLHETGSQRMFMN